MTTSSEPRDPLFPRMYGRMDAAKPLDIICGAMATSGMYICMARDGAPGCEQGMHRFEDIKNFECCDGWGYADYAAVHCPNPHCLSDRIAGLT